jgi:hypothetical protein
MFVLKIITLLHFRVTGSILICVNELDDVWSQMLAEATENARLAGRHDVADYLALRANNDQIRAGGVRWLFDSAVELASEANRTIPAITIERDDPHSFAFLGANVVGSRLNLRQGVRCLSLEAGWTRTPSDGFMRGGALAAARISHFGMKRHEAVLALLLTDDLPEWFRVSEFGPREHFNLEALRRHFEIFIGA